MATSAASLQMAAASALQGGLPQAAMSLQMAAASALQGGGPQARNCNIWNLPNVMLNLCHFSDFGRWEGLIYGKRVGEAN